MHDLKQRYDAMVAERILLEQEKQEKKKKLYKIQRQIDKLIQARIVMVQVAKLTQENFKDHIESLVNLAVQSVFGERYTFQLQFAEGGKPEASPIIMENNKPLDPKQEMGGSIIDIISFAFRVVLWSIESKRSRNIFILDEPFRFCGDYIWQAGEILQKLSKELGFQVIIITHEQEKLYEYVDRMWKVTRKRKRSKVQLIKG